MTDGPEQIPPSPPPGAPQGSPTPPPTGTAPEKKGLSPLAWVGIGCGALLVIGLIAVSVVLYTSGKWLGDRAKQVQEEGIRIKAGDEEVTVGLKDGKGAFTVRDQEGKTRFRVGAGGEDDIPAWVPRYRNAEAQGTYYSESDGEISGGFTFETDDSVDDVVAYFGEAFQDADFEETGRTTSQAGGTRYANLTAEGDGRTVSVMATGEDGATQVVVSFSGRAE